MPGNKAGKNPTNEQILSALWRLSVSPEEFVRIAHAQEISLAEIDSYLVRIGERRAIPD